jgi:hypothetical protein
MVGMDLDLSVVGIGCGFGDTEKIITTNGAKVEVLFCYCVYTTQ